jgi:hypothetical protein
MLSGTDVGDWEELAFKDDLTRGRDNIDSGMTMRIFEEKVTGIGALLHVCQAIY